MKGSRKTTVRKAAVIALVMILLLAAGTYAGIAIYFQDHFFCNTTIGGTDFSYKTPVEAEYMIYESLTGYSLEIVGREGIQDTISRKEINMDYIFGDSLVKLMQEQKPALWILGFIKGYDYELPPIVQYDEEALRQRIDGLAFFKKENIMAPKDAYIDYSEEDQQYIIVDARPGTEIEKGKAEETIRESILSLNDNLNLEEAGCYKQPDMERDNEELLAALDLANRYLSAHITYDWNGNEVLIDSAVIRKWVNVNRDKVLLDEKAIEKFIARQSEEYDTYGKNRVFYTTGGKEIDLNNGTFGWLTDQESELPELVKAIKNGETIKKQPAHSEKERKSWQVLIEDSYVEIDLGMQHLYLYVDGELILESDFVSGNASRGWGTPAGVFGLTYKARNAVLRGTNYETPVSYWMPFNGNIGMHDATWRSAFGGDIYRTNGSHGCINLPFEKAKIIYDYVYTGFPVICYY